MKAKIGNLYVFPKQKRDFMSNGAGCAATRHDIEAVRRISLAAAATERRDFGRKSGPEKSQKKIPTRRSAAGVRSDRPFAWQARGD